MSGIGKGSRLRAALHVQLILSLYVQLPVIAVQAYGALINDVKTGAYPQPEHGFSMDAEELAKFKDMVDADVH